MARMISMLFAATGRGLVWLTAATMIAGAATLAAVPAAAARQGPDSIADLAERLIDAVVYISTTQTVAENRRNPLPNAPEGAPFQHFFDDFFDHNGSGQDGGDEGGDGGPQKVQSLGSGFVVDESGIIITNNHVIENADEVVVNFNDGSKLKADLVGHDEKTDIAVLRVRPEKPLTAVHFGDSQKMRVGDWVMAIGNPFGLGGTVTTGIVSARNRDINSGPYDNYLQTDAAINRGNSGGPLFNQDGEVIGINTAIISPSGGSIGIGFAVPSEIAAPVVDQLRQFGETRRGWLGVNIQAVTDDLADSLGLGRAHGALVAAVTEGGPAAAGGIRAGDVIVGFDGHAIGAMHELPRLVANTGIGRTVKVAVIRKGAEMTFDVTLGRLEEGGKTVVAQKPASAPPPADERVLGLKLAALDDAVRAKYGIGADVKGVVITDVAEDSAAADKHIQAGDVVVEVAQESVDKPEDVTAAVARQKGEGRRSVLLLLSDAAGALRFEALRFD